MPVHLGQDLHVVAMALDPRCPDEDGAERLGPNPVDLDVGLEARDLTAESIAPGRDVEEAKMLAVENDEPGAGPEDRAPGIRMCPDGAGEPVALDGLADRGALAAGDDQGVE